MQEPMVDYWQDLNDVPAAPQSHTCTLTAVTHVPEYRNVEWDWFSAISDLDLDGYENPEWERACMRDFINNLVASHSSKDWIRVSYQLVNNDSPDGAEQEYFDVSIGWSSGQRGVGSRTFQYVMPRYPLFHKDLYSHLVMFAYLVADAVEENSCIQPIFDPGM